MNACNVIQWVIVIYYATTMAVLLFRIWVELKHLERTVDRTLGSSKSPNKKTRGERACVEDAG